MKFIKKSGKNVIVEMDKQQLEYFYSLASRDEDTSAREIAALLKYVYPPPVWAYEDTR